MSVEEKLYGCQSMTGVLRRVLVRAPRAEDLHGWQRCGWRSEPDAAGIAREHEAFCSLLADAGAEVVLAESAAPGNPDAIYTYDPALVADEGALLLHPGKKCRRAEVNAMAEDFERAGVPVAGRLSEAAWAEGGDCCWLDAVMHLMSLISPLAPDLAVVYEPLLPARLAQLLRARDVELVRVPDEEFDSMGSNVLALAPRVALAVEGNPVTRERMERAGAAVLTYLGKELSKGDGGPTCLTRPLLRV